MNILDGPPEKGNKIFILCFGPILELFISIPLTILKVFRLHSTLPKHSIPISRCALLMAVGSSCFSSIGNKYQLNCPITSMISSNTLVTRSASSHEMKTILSAQSISKNEPTYTAKPFSSFIY